MKIKNNGVFMGHLSLLIWYTKPQAVSVYQFHIRHIFTSTHILIRSRFHTFSIYHLHWASLMKKAMNSIFPLHFLLRWQLERPTMVVLYLNLLRHFLYWAYFFLIVNKWMEKNATKEMITLVSRYLRTWARLLYLHNFGFSFLLAWIPFNSSVFHSCQ